MQRKFTMSEPDDRYFGELAEAAAWMHPEVTDRPPLARLDQLLGVGELRFDSRTIESIAAPLEEELHTGAFHVDLLRQFRLPLRLRRLAQLLQEGDAERAAYQAFLAGIDYAGEDPRTRGVWEELIPNLANRRGKGTDPAAVRKEMELLVRAQPQIRATEAYRKVARKVNLAPRTVRRLAPFKSLKAGVSGGARTRGEDSIPVMERGQEGEVATRHVHGESDQ